MKRTIALLLVLLMAITVFTACDSGSKKNDETSKAGSDGKTAWHIGMTVGDLSNPIWAEVCGQAEKRAKELGCKLEVVSCNNDAPTQVSQVETFISQKVDEIIIGAADAASLADVCRKAMAQGILVMAYGVHLPVYSVSLTNDNPRAGEIIGEMAADFINKNYGGKAEVGLITFYENVECLQRGDAMKATLKKKCPNATIVQECSTCVADQAMTYVENWLQSNPDMKVIMSIGDGGGIGANQAVKAAGKADGFGIFAIDGTIEALQLMVNGDPIRGEIAFGAGWQLGNQVMDVAYAALTQKDFVVDNVTPTEVVTLDSLEKWIKDWKYEDRIDLSNLKK